MKNYIAFVFDASWNTLKGLWVTLKVLFLPSITVQYPTEKIVPYARFRGMLAYDAEACIACGMCVRACPSKCIALAKAAPAPVSAPVEGQPAAPAAKPKIEWYTIDYGRCNFCGLCEESCPTKPKKALWHSLDYEAIFSTRAEMVRRWKRGDDLWGTARKTADGQLAPITDQIHIQSVPVRK
ncbi:MAG: NADH-quinone oxidoreductase subunit I [Elusimicrobiales bacterium]|nr:NADH-quinone oxidoreductase subunit I [Elusimicrobiales bacterium]